MEESYFNSPEGKALSGGGLVGYRRPGRRGNGSSSISRVGSNLGQTDRPRLAHDYHLAHFGGALSLRSAKRVFVSSCSAGDGCWKSHSRLCCYDSRRVACTRICLVRYSFARI